MNLFGPKVKVRRPVAEIVAGLSGMVEELEESNIMAADEQQAVETDIAESQIVRKLLISEQAKAGTVVGNLKTLLGLDLDGDGEADDLDRAIAAFAKAGLLSATRTEPDDIDPMDRDPDDHL
jgi:hypothetical protein